MRPSPLPSNPLRCFGVARVRMERCQNFPQTEPVTHGQGKLSQQLARMSARNRNAQDSISPRYGQYLDEALAGAIDNRAV
jgi:hypothetical protein